MLLALFSLLYTDDIQSNYDAFINQKPTLILYTAYFCPHCQYVWHMMVQAETAFRRQINQDYIDFQLAEFKCYIDNGLCQSLGIGMYPTLLFYHNNQYYQFNDYSQQSIIQLLISVLEVDNFEYQQPYFYITDITDQKIDSILSSNEWNVVQYVKNNCRQCSQTDPIINELAKYFDDKVQDPEAGLSINGFTDVQVSRINCDNTQYCKKTFKTLPIPAFILNKGKQFVKQLHNYGQLDDLIDEIENTINDIVYYNIVPVQYMSQKQFFNIKNQYVCLVLTQQGISDQPYELQIKKLIQVYENSDKIVISAVNCKTESKLCSLLKPERLPSVYFTYEQEVKDIYQNNMNYDHIRDFIDKQIENHQINSGKKIKQATSSLLNDFKRNRYNFIYFSNVIQGYHQQILHEVKRFKHLMAEIDIDIYVCDCVKQRYLCQNLNVAQDSIIRLYEYDHLLKTIQRFNDAYDLRNQVLSHIDYI